MVFGKLNHELHRTDVRLRSFCANLIVAISSSSRVRSPCASQHVAHSVGVYGLQPIAVLFSRVKTLLGNVLYERTLGSSR